MGGSTVAYCIDAAVEAMQLTALRSPHSRPSAQAHLFELPQRDDSVLPRSDIRYPRVKRVAFVPH